MVNLNFKCLKCNSYFDCDVGYIDFIHMIDNRPQFENPIICSNCNSTLIVVIKEVELTEFGQTQIGDEYFNGK
jgi:hypothetical protein